jgi:hypothetical protein
MVSWSGYGPTTDEMGGIAMIKHALAVAVAAALMVGGSAASGFAENKKKKAASARTPSAATSAMRTRQKQCAAEWKEAKSAGKVEAGMKWPKYWSACNKRLKSSS